MITGKEYLLPILVPGRLAFLILKEPAFEKNNEHWSSVFQQRNKINGFCPPKKKKRILYSTYNHVPPEQQCSQSLHKSEAQSGSGHLCQLHSPVSERAKHNKLINMLTIEYK